MFKSVLVLGAGSAGLFAALTLKRKMPHIMIRVVRSPEIGIIGVGESTTPNLLRHLFEYLGLNRKDFYRIARPTWKNGINFLWGPRGQFFFPFEYQLDVRLPQLERPNGFYCDDDFQNVNFQTALLLQRKAFLRQENGVGPDFNVGHAFHLDNPRLVAALEHYAKQNGIEFIDGKVAGVTTGPQGIDELILEDERRLTADFFIDASGFRSELLGKAMQEPFISYSSSLFNDRALVGSWDRQNPDGTFDQILPYTTAETMDAGWCWRIEHEEKVNRGYVFSSNTISEEQAREEMQRKNPKAKLADKLIKFRSGRLERAWVRNVMAIGNAGGFVEPLESTALMVVCWQCETFVEMIKHAGLTPQVTELFNRVWGNSWDEIRDFLTLHFWANTKLNTPYWQHCNHDTDISRIKPMIDFYQDVGPTGYLRYFMQPTGSQFGVEGYLVMFVGNKIKYQNRYQAPPHELEYFEQMRTHYRLLAEQRGMDVAEALSFVHHPHWIWHGDKEQN